MTETEWLYPPDTVRGRADRAQADLCQRTLAEYADGSNADPSDEKARRARERHATGPPSATAR
jgi:hypothetical protein